MYECEYSNSKVLNQVLFHSNSVVALEYFFMSMSTRPVSAFQDRQ